jgi:hypothetical protein
VSANWTGELIACPQLKCSNLLPEFEGISINGFCPFSVAWKKSAICINSDWIDCVYIPSAGAFIVYFLRTFFIDL